MKSKVLMAALATMMMSGVLSAAITAEQKAALLFMYQEEKVARDVYLTLGKKYPTAKTFSNIALSEQTHTDSVEKLCIKYGVNISGVNEASIGNFVLPELQSLYDTLVIQGSVSLTEGLKVGVAIEEKDIRDIMTYAEGMPSDVQRTFQNLLNGSYSHLDAFNNALK
jgi:hypothetical protein